MKLLTVIRNVVRGSWTVSCEAVARVRSVGWQSGWTCLQSNLLNAWRRVQNKFLPPAAACPCCGWQGYGFLNVDCGKFAVPEAVCPNCRGQERHRLMHLFLTRRPPEFMRQQQRGKVLHFAAEPQVRAFLDANPNLNTIATDFEWYMVQGAPRPGVHADIQHLPFADNSMAGIYNLHVLEHIPDDRQAIRELNRVLAPEGQAVIVVPFMFDRDETYEYGAPDPFMFGHVRGYSLLDFKDRLSPFTYEEVLPSSFVSAEELHRFRIPEIGQVIYVCRKG